MKNFYDMTQVSGKSISDAKRIQAQSADYLAKYDASLKESLQAEEDRKMNAAMSGARFGYAANVARSNNRVNRLSEEIRYTNESSVIGMTEMVANVVESGLLLDESELVKIYPEYKEDIRSIVKDFLKEGNINSVISDNRTLQLMEYVAATLPSAREGVSLTEDELSNYIAINKPLDIDRTIKNLGGDVATRVATLMEKEQKKADQIEKDVKRAKAKEAKATAKDEISAEELITQLEAGQISEDDLNEMLANGEISQNTYDEVIGVYEDAANGEIEGVDPAQAQQAAPEQTPVTTSAEAPPEEEEMAGDPSATAMGQDPSVMGAEGGMDPAMSGDPSATAMGQDPSMMGNAGVPAGMPKKQVQMLPDGTMNINIYESDFSLVRETLRCGLIESLAVNEADTMLKEGKEYDGDLCLAKAIMYVTITESMAEMGLMNVDEKKYSEIISAAGGSLNEKVKYSRNDLKANPYLPTSNKTDAKYAAKVKLDAAKEEYKNAGKENLAESVLVSQYAPVRNDISSCDSIAERIRRKRLNEQSNILHD